MRQSRAFFAMAAIVMLTISLPAAGEPYSGDPKADPAVQICSWVMLILYSLVLGALLAIVHCRAELKSRRFFLLTVMYTAVVASASVLSGAFAILVELVSLVLHLLF